MKNLDMNLFSFGFCFSKQMYLWPKTSPFFLKWPIKTKTLDSPVVEQHNWKDDLLNMATNFALKLNNQSDMTNKQIENIISECNFMWKTNITLIKSLILQNIIEEKKRRNNSYVRNLFQYSI